jgi:hypothetical protein
MDISGGRRSLPLFDIDDQDPEARGFCRNGFYWGLNPAENFFHTLGGREGLTNTALSTAVTGTINRRLTKAMENISVYPDGSVRYATGTLVQPIYGGDGLRPNTLVNIDAPGLDYANSFIDVAQLADKLNGSAGYVRQANVEQWFQYRQERQKLERTNLLPRLQALGGN